jgi:hypothetical protein
MASDGGKGSARRKEDAQAVRDNWDRIFGSKGTKAVSQEIKEHEMIRDDDPQERSDEDYERSEDYTDDIDDSMQEDCSLCGGCGEGNYDGASCRRCHGTGVEPRERDCDDDF